MRPHVFTISAGRPFVDVIAKTLLVQTGGAPERLADYHILLPTRRAVRALTEAFLRHADGRTVLLPQLTPLGDLDEEGLAFVAGEDCLDGAAIDLPPAMPGLRRQVVLARLILEMPGRADTADQALRLAQELGRLLDQVSTERLSLADLGNLVPDDFAEHWQITLKFLEILTDAWPAILAEAGCVDGGMRRNMLLDRRAELWRKNPPSTPVIAAGSTGSIPATADLLAVVASLPQGAVIVPGLDSAMDDAAWAALEPHHPQYGLAQLLEVLSVRRDEIAEWGLGVGAVAASGELGDTMVHRFRALSQALRPAAVTGKAAADGRSRGSDNTMRNSLENVTRVDCPTPSEEAAVIALSLREALETPGRTAALVTPDRMLARRVKAELARWRIEVDDSAGVPLAETPPGAFLRLTAALAVDRFQPVALLATLKHPLAGLGMAPPVLRTLIRRLEMAILRGPRPAPGLAGLRSALANVPDKADLTNLVDRLEAGATHLNVALAQAGGPLRDLATAHLRFAEILAATDDDLGDHRLWAGEAGEAAAQFMAEVMDAANALGPVRGRDYPALLDSLMAGRGVRPRYGGHPRLAIWGLLEARLQHADLVILGGLNEGVWPPDPKPSPWMSRPMMAKYGLPQPERRVGLTAHDFVQAMMAPQVIITRAGRVDGAPTVPARWLLRLDNLLAGAKDNESPNDVAASVLKSDRVRLAWAAALDKPDALVTPTRPLPRPPVGLRPIRLSVTQVEAWVRDPYAIYARHILKLRPLDPIDADPGAADKGNLIHDALERFVAAYPRDLPDDAERTLLDIGEAVFAELADRPGVRAFWWPRFRRIARWFVDNERKRRQAGISPLAWEVTGTRELSLPEGGFTLSAKADRLDRGPGGGLVVVDYKTGTAPSWAMAEVGFSPQLPLEAAISETGGFADVPAGSVETLNYLRITGGRDAGEDRRRDLGTMAEDALAGLARRVARFAQESTPYPPRLKPMYDNFDGDYDHLARVRAWSALGEEDGS